EVRRLWPSPQALLEKIGGYLTGSPLSLSVQAMEGELSALYQTCLARVAELKQQWLQHHQDITPCIEGSDLHAATKKALLKRVDF
ncbi:hypothetical protein, partial [Vibrio vulnificus]